MYEIDFLRAGDGNADAICFRYGDDDRGYWLHIIDGGFIDTADLMIAHIEEHYGKHYKISNMVLSHADNDHACGLIGVLKRFDVNGAIYMNRPWQFARQILPAYPGYTEERLVKEIKEKHSYLVEIEEIAARKGIDVRDVFQGTIIGPFTVLAPFRDRYIRTRSPTSRKRPSRSIASPPPPKRSSARRLKRSPSG
jgi:glyoxylase-like metal-dependent hydrolase (beta-lactamase superfamily II)